MSVAYIIMGIKHCGKSTIGKALADSMDFSFIDLDIEVEREYSKNRSFSFREIYKKEGKEGFHKLETAALKRLYGGSSAEPSVLALGGGTVENPEAVKILKTCGLKIYLKESEDTLFKRIISSGLPPFLDGQNPKEQFHDLYLKRDLMHTELADLIVELEGRSPSAALDAVIKSIRNHSGSI